MIRTPTARWSDERSAVIAIAASRGQGRSLVPLVTLLAEGHHVVSWHDRGAARVDVVVASDPEVLATMDPAAIDAASTDQALDSIQPVERPLVACRVRSAAEFDAAQALAVAVTFTDLPEMAAPDGGLGDAEPILAPASGIDLRRHPVVPPLARARMREAYGLVEPLLVAVDRRAPAPSVSTSLALASAAVVTDPELVPLALALGTPAVVSTATASRFGLTDGVEVLVATTDVPAEADGLAAALARDDARCAALSRRARRFAERHLDLGAASRSLRRELALEPEPSLVDLRLEELATPMSSRLRDRAHDALALFTLEPAP